jgi:hypothetical protein
MKKRNTFLKIKTIAFKKNILKMPPSTKCRKRK